MRGGGVDVEGGIGAGRRDFLLNAISCINRSWQPPLSYDRHEAPLLAWEHTTISQQARQQVRNVKTRKSYHY
jgi:hypothetical protein